MLVKIRLEIRGKLILAGRKPPAKINLPLISNSMLTSIVSHQLRLTYPYSLIVG
jgi:hypothetical protein